MTLTQSFITGFRSANKSWRMTLLLYGINFFFAALVALAFRSLLVNAFGNSMAIDRMTQDFDATVFIDFIKNHYDKVSVFIAQVSWLALFSMFVNTFLGGGILTILNGSEEAFSLKSFFHGCGAYVFRFLRLFVLFAIMLVIFGLLWLLILEGAYNALAEDAVSEVEPFYLFLVFAALYLLPVMLLILAADYAKIAMVVEERRSAFKALWRATTFVARHVVKTFTLQLSIFVIVLAIILVYWLIEGQMGMSTPGTILATFVVQQIAVAGKVWTRVLTFGSELALFRGLAEKVERPVEAVPPEQVPPPVPTPEPVAEIPPTKAPPARRRTPRRRGRMQKAPLQRKTRKKRK